jgi:hypothetical protein
MYPFYLNKSKKNKDETNKKGKVTDFLQFLNLFFSIIVVLKAHCNIYQSSYNVS